jgi:hypothetical protein
MARTPFQAKSYPPDLCAPARASASVFGPAYICSESLLHQEVRTNAAVSSAFEVVRTFKLTGDDNEARSAVDSTEAETRLSSGNQPPVSNADRQNAEERAKDAAPLHCPAETHTYTTTRQSIWCTCSDKEQVAADLKVG